MFFGWKKIGLGIVAGLVLAIADEALHTNGWLRNAGFVAYLFLGGSGIADFCERRGVSRVNGIWIVTGPFAILPLHMLFDLQKARDKEARKASIGDISQEREVPKAESR